MNFRQGVKRDYWACRVGYESSLSDLVKTGLSEGAADDYLFAKDAVREAGEREGDDRIAKATAVLESARAALKN
jgi:hypothetical protein